MATFNEGMFLPPVEICTVGQIHWNKLLKMGSDFRPQPRIRQLTNKSPTFSLHLMGMRSICQKTQHVKMPLWLFPVLLPIKLIRLMKAGLLHSINNIRLSLLCLLQLLPSIVAPWLRKHNVRTARRSGPRVKWSRGRSRDPGSVFGYIITNRKSLQAGHTGPLPSFVYRGVWFKLPKTKLYQCVVLQHPFCPLYLYLSLTVLFVFHSSMMVFLYQIISF